MFNQQEKDTQQLRERAAKAKREDELDYRSWERDVHLADRILQGDLLLII
ncbi:hypothetical protein GKZ89_14025 [Bacillus mangrovi]|uniref:Uncharacterized protein n=1 Tax=Metabacillus mangrovi TaxID=1491830 RepID=A0A7X2S748_9BACI|nr:hypothetical protein [Metabacillus mangrovi]MTH54518.1 hypothetical protein [Metabacillus mangrovi]